MSDPRRRSITPRIRFEVLKRDGFACAYCGARAGAEVQLVVDHIEPVALGGESHIDNYAAACGACNTGKGAVRLLPLERQRWMDLADDIIAVLNRDGRDASLIEMQIAVELASFEEYGPGGPGPAAGVAPVLLAHLARDAELHEYLAGNGWEFGVDEAFSVTCWLALLRFREGLDMPDWRGGVHE